MKTAFVLFLALAHATKLSSKDRKDGNGSDDEDDHEEFAKISSIACGDGGCISDFALRSDMNTRLEITDLRIEFQNLKTKVYGDVYYLT
jgi:hypothetical protein